MKKLSTLLTIITVTSFSQLFSMDRQVSATVTDRPAIVTPSLREDASITDMQKLLREGGKTALAHKQQMARKNYARSTAFKWIAGGTALAGTLATGMQKANTAARRSGSSESSPLGTVIRWGAISATTLGAIKLTLNYLDRRSVRGIIEQQQDQLVQAGELMQRLSKAENATAEELRELRQRVLTNAQAIHTTAGAVGDLADVVQELKEGQLPPIEDAPDWLKEE